MRSPFPGMDPYLERQDFWSDFHNNLASEIRASLNQKFLPKYVARATRYVTYDVLEVTAPVESAVQLEVPFRQHNVEIRQAETKKLVTIIEILSPVNKRSGHEAHDDYLRKRRKILRSAVHLLEIDLLRGGIRPPLERPVPPAAYYVTLCRENRRPIAEVWPLQLTDPLPVLPVPLLHPDPDVPLDLGQVVASVYERGAYWVEIDYRQPPPPPPLSEEAQAQVEALLQQADLSD